MISVQSVLVLLQCNYGRWTMMLCLVGVVVPQHAHLRRPHQNQGCSLHQSPTLSESSSSAAAALYQECLSR